MGYFGTFTYSGGHWTLEDGPPQEAPLPPTEPFLSVSIFDSDWASFLFSPAPHGVGRFYLGVEPYIYFDDPDASSPVDAVAEANAFSAWIEQTEGRHVAPGAILALLPRPNDENSVDVFVEETVTTLVERAGLPAVPWP